MDATNQTAMDLGNTTTTKNDTATPAPTPPKARKRLKVVDVGSETATKAEAERETATKAEAEAERAQRIAKRDARLTSAKHKRAAAKARKEGSATTCATCGGSVSEVGLTFAPGSTLPVCTVCLEVPPAATTQGQPAPAKAAAELTRGLAESLGVASGFDAATVRAFARSIADAYGDGQPIELRVADDVLTLTAGLHSDPVSVTVKGSGNPAFALTVRAVSLVNAIKGHRSVTLNGEDVTDPKAKKGKVCGVVLHHVDSHGFVRFEATPGGVITALRDVEVALAHASDVVDTGGRAELARVTLQNVDGKLWASGCNGIAAHRVSMGVDDARDVARDAAGASLRTVDASAAQAWVSIVAALEINPDERARVDAGRFYGRFTVAHERGEVALVSHYELGARVANVKPAFFQKPVDMFAYQTDLGRMFAVGVVPSSLRNAIEHALAEQEAHVKARMPALEQRVKAMSTKDVAAAREGKTEQAKADQKVINDRRELDVCRHAVTATYDGKRLTVRATHGKTEHAVTLEPRSTLAKTMRALAKASITFNANLAIDAMGAFPLPVDGVELQGSCAFIVAADGKSSGVATNAQRSVWAALGDDGKASGARAGKGKASKG